MMITDNSLRVIAIGDVGGHYDQLVNTLIDLGIDLSTSTIPKNLVIIQVGDLIHKGPYSDDIVALVDDLIRVNSDDLEKGSWYQCFGNHEMLHIPGGVQFHIRCACSDQTIETLQRWWDEKQAYIAVGIRHEYGLEREDFTIATHAGITMIWWRKAGRKTGHSGPEVVQFLNQLREETPRTLNNAGIMLGGGSSFQASPVWAEASNEVYRSWDEDYMPFSQIHGHTCSFAWDQKEWYRSVPLKFRAKTKGTFGQTIRLMKVDEQHRRVTMHNTGGGGTFYSIDPGFTSRNPGLTHIPYLEVEGALEIVV